MSEPHKGRKQKEVQRRKLQRCEKEKKKNTLFSSGWRCNYRVMQATMHTVKAKETFAIFYQLNIFFKKRKETKRNVEGTEVFHAFLFCFHTQKNPQSSRFT